ncbi:VOC family protein [Sagittula sp. S175]|uniref:VOC family protein n=1 Tax=Sagittula sp. S175 TaxID=3415129 RepID=UPI003C7D58F4
MFKMTLDHIAVLGETLAEAVRHVEKALGQPMEPGGVHPRFGTHNQLIGLNPELYIEAIAIDPSAPDLPDARWFGLDTFQGPPRLDKWICAVDDMAAALEALPMAGRPVELSRGTLSWTMAVPEDGLLPYDGLFPALIQWHTPVPPGKSLAADDNTLTGLVVSHPLADALQALLAPHLDAPLVRFQAGAPGLTATIHQCHTEKTLQ